MITIPGLDSYFGGKGGAGVPQAIINEIPEHDIYCEPFLGRGAILCTKKPAPLYNIGCELNPNVTELWQLAKLNKQHNFIIHKMCGLAFLEHICSNAIYTDVGRRVFVFADPPYLHETRKSMRKRYQFEFTREDHERLLTILLKLPFSVAISHYKNDMYDSYLKRWRTIPFKSVTRGGQVTETLYMNYPEPTTLHDYRFLGSDFRERERIRKKIQRHVNGLQKLPLHERNAIIEAITTKI